MSNQKRDVIKTLRFTRSEIAELEELQRLLQREREAAEKRLQRDLHITFKRRREEPPTLPEVTFTETVFRCLDLGVDQLRARLEESSDG
jgi:hypothetical protein